SHLVRRFAPLFYSTPLLCRSHLLHPPSFPTRRSSDLDRQGHNTTGNADRHNVGIAITIPADSNHLNAISNTRNSNSNTHAAALRSEEHTSELQSRFDLVCRLLLEKKEEWTAHIEDNSG